MTFRLPGVLLCMKQYFTSLKCRTQMKRLALGEGVRGVAMLRHAGFPPKCTWADGCWFPTADVVMADFLSTTRLAALV